MKNSEKSLSNFSIECKKLGLDPKTTSQHALECIKLGLDPEISQHELECAKYGLDPKKTSINELKKRGSKLYKQ